MSYEQFAYLYDELMKDAPYSEWVQFVKSRLETFGVKGVDLLDLACGTGELSVRFAKEGFKVSGVDLSSDMLAVAQAKAEAEGLKIPFYEQNMVNLEGQAEFQIITIFCDSLNYLETEEEVRQTFNQVYQHLANDGLFFFDVHSIYKVTEVFTSETFTHNEDDLAYIWNSFPGDVPHSVEHELTFFVLDDETGQYDRVDELHVQRTYPVEQYLAWLDRAGFKVLEVSADFSEDAPNHESERIFFTAKKNK